MTFFGISWTVGMMAMMLPTAMPLMLIFFRSARGATSEIRLGGGPTIGKAFLFIASYIGIWVGTGVLFYLGVAIASTLVWPGLSAFLASRFGAGVALLLVGVYQISPVKGECVSKCHPSNFLFQHYRSGRLGALKMGLVYAKYCVGCCWVMMVFLLLVAAMGVGWMALFAFLIFAERTVFHGPWVSRIIGIAFVVIGIILVKTG